MYYDRFLRYCREGNLPKVKKLVKYCNIYNLIDGFLNACIYANLPTVIFLMKKSSTDKRPTDINHGLLCACLGGNKTVVHYLLNRGAGDINYAMWYAAGSAQISIVKLMVERGANKFTEAFDYMCEGVGDIEIAKYLLEKGAEVTDHAFVYACYYGHYLIIKLLVDTNNNAIKIHNYNGIYHACSAGHFDIVKLLIKYIPRELIQLISQYQIF